jgi:hypothetical protein
VFAIHQEIVRSRSLDISKQSNGDSTPAVVEFFNPMSDENPRLVSEGGLFTRGPDGVDLETWVKDSIRGTKVERDNDLVLGKLVIPNKGRELFLRFLNRMNINHLSLFPDLAGACMFCNFELELEEYGNS